MPVVYVKEADNPSRTEITLESVGDHAVKDFRAIVLEKFDIPLEELCECAEETLTSTVLSCCMSQLSSTQLRKSCTQIKCQPLLYLLGLGMSALLMWLKPSVQPIYTYEANCTYSFISVPASPLTPLASNLFRVNFPALRYFHSILCSYL